MQRVVDESEWRDAAYRAAISKGARRGQQQAFKRAKEDLISAQMVGVNDDLVWLTSGDANMRTPL